MKKIWIAIGRICFWIAWPGIWLVVKVTPPRTRLVVVHDKKILLTKDWLGAGDWTLPGGGLRQGEDPAEGAVRELMEETGIKVATHQCVKFGMKTLKGRGITSRNHCFIISLQHKPRIYLHRPEILAYTWATLDDLKDLNVGTTVMPVVRAFSRTSDLLQ
jgi:8-oxo-dGTP pyrophosphatase MutT (NUDIX family)